LIYRVPLKSGSQAYIYALIEHKSAPDKWVAVQILRYEVATWDAEIKARARRLTPIIPIVFYHGAKKWNAPQEFSALAHLGGNEALRQYVPEFRYHLTDLSQYEDEEMREAIVNVILLVMMLLMRNIFSKGNYSASDCGSAALMCRQAMLFRQRRLLTPLRPGRKQAVPRNRSEAQPPVRQSRQERVASLPESLRLSAHQSQRAAQSSSLTKRLSSYQQRVEAEGRSNHRIVEGARQRRELENRDKVSGGNDGEAF
jgi:hypothetical protein